MGTGCTLTIIVSMCAVGMIIIIIVIVVMVTVMRVVSVCVGMLKLTGSKDADMGKQTLVTLLGLDGARAEAEKRAARAVEALGPYAARAPELSALPFFLLGRDA